MSKIRLFSALRGISPADPKMMRIFENKLMFIWSYYYFPWQYLKNLKIIIFSVTICEQMCVFVSINPSLLSSQTTKIDFVCMYYDVWGTRSSNLIVPGAENGLKCQKNWFLVKFLKFVGWVGGMSRRRWNFVSCLVLFVYRHPPTWYLSNAAPCWAE